MEWLMGLALVPASILVVLCIALYFEAGSKGEGLLMMIYNWEHPEEKKPLSHGNEV